MGGGHGQSGICFARTWYLDRKAAQVTEYIPFLVIGIFAVVLFLGTIIWTEYLFPENKKTESKQKELNFPDGKSNTHELISTQH